MIGKRETNKLVKKVIRAFSLTTDHRINDALLEAMDVIPYEYGTTGWNYICYSVIDKLRELAAKS